MAKILLRKISSNYDGLDDRVKYSGKKKFWWSWHQFAKDYFYATGLCDEFKPSPGSDVFVNDLFLCSSGVLEDAYRRFNTNSGRGAEKLTLKWVRLYLSRRANGKV